MSINLILHYSCPQWSSHNHCMPHHTEPSYTEGAAFTAFTEGAAFTTFIAAFTAFTEGAALTKEAVFFTEVSCVPKLRDCLSTTNVFINDWDCMANFSQAIARDCNVLAFNSAWAALFWASFSFFACNAAAKQREDFHHKYNHTKLHTNCIHTEWAELQPACDYTRVSNWTLFLGIENGVREALSLSPVCVYMYIIIYIIIYPLIGFLHNQWLFTEIGLWISLCQ